MAEDFTPRYESYPDRLIREAMERGDFADNPLRGKPVKLGRPGEQKSWIQERLEREDLSAILRRPGSPAHWPMCPPSSRHARSSTPSTSASGTPT